MGNENKIVFHFIHLNSFLLLLLLAEEIQDQAVEAGILEVLLEYLLKFSTDEDVVTHCLLVLSCLADSSKLYLNSLTVFETVNEMCFSVAILSLKIDLNVFGDKKLNKFSYSCSHKIVICYQKKNCTR